MAYEIKCLKCDGLTYAANIVDLIDEHTDHAVDENGGMIQCEHCEKQGYILNTLKLQEKDQTWNRHIRGVFRIPTEFETYFPYVYLTSNEKDEKPFELQISYYKDLRKNGGRLKHGHGPGGTPSIDKNGLLRIVKNLMKMKIISPLDLEKIIDQAR